MSRFEGDTRLRGPSINSLGGEPTRSNFRDAAEICEKGLAVVSGRAFGLAEIPGRPGDDSDRCEWQPRPGDPPAVAIMETLSGEHRTTTLDALRNRLVACNNRVRDIVEQNRQRATGRGGRIPGRREVLSDEAGRCLGKALSKDTRMM